MTNEEKLELFKVKISPDETSDEIALAYLDDAKDLILNRIYELTGIPEGIDEVPSRYQRTQVKLAVELFSKRGAEGESSHSENGISRTYSRKGALSEVIPMIATVIKN